MSEDGAVTPPEYVVLHEDCLGVLRSLPDASVDSVVTDPPYGLSNTDPAHVTDAVLRWAQGDREYVPEGKGFMGQAWDAFVPPPAVWDECLRVLKPGGHLLCFAGSRTVDLMMLSIRLAGFDVRDTITWHYGNGMPKSLDVLKAIDKAVGVERTEGARTWQGGQRSSGVMGKNLGTQKLVKYDTPATPQAQSWQGFGSALKPASEPIVVARKPFKGTVASNVLEHGTGALNIDGTRIATTDVVQASASGGVPFGEGNYEKGTGWIASSKSGRWPANVVLTHTEDCEQVGEQRVKGDSRTGGEGTRDPGFGDVRGQTDGNGKPAGVLYGDETVPVWDCAPDCPVAELDRQSGTGGASRFFYVAKAKKSERPVVETKDGRRIMHPTVKPLGVMRWLVRLVTPPGGLVLDPFAGSGATLEAAYLEGFDSAGCEREDDYVLLIHERMRKHRTEG